jgi:hypothetical protein
MQDIEYVTAIMFVFFATIAPVLILSVIADYVTKRLKNKENEKN